jgi:transposase InsO family protein
MRARAAIWWPGLSQHIEDRIKHCVVCAKESTPRREPLILSTLPELPWQKVGSDLFTLNGINYLLVIDYFSRYPELVKLTSTTSSSIMNALKSVFSRHGIPQVLVSDNGPQYASQEFASFARKYTCH